MLFIRNVMTNMDKDGTIRHYRDGVLHNDNGPSVIYTNGFKAYYTDGDLTSATDQNGLTYLISTKTDIEFPDGSRYRKRGNFITYIMNGLYHNDYGYAFKDYDEGIAIWFNRGQEIKRQYITKPTPNPNRSDLNEDGTEDDYENDILVRKHGPDGSIDFYDASGDVSRRQDSKGIIWILDTDGYWIKETKPKTTPKITLDTDNDGYVFSVELDSNTYSVRVSNNLVEHTKNGKFHRDHDLPARKTETSWEYYKDGTLIKKSPALDKPPSIGTLVNRQILASKIKDMPDVTQETIDELTMGFLEDELQGFYVIQQFEKVLEATLEPLDWFKLRKAKSYLPQCTHRLSELLEKNPSEDNLDVAIDIFNRIDGIWREYAAYNNIASKQSFVQRVYNRAVKDSFSDEFLAKLFKFLMG